MKYSETIINAILKSSQELSFFVLDKSLKYVEFSESHKSRLKLLWGIEPKIGKSMLDLFSNEKEGLDFKKIIERVFRKETVIQIDTRRSVGQNQALFIQTVWSPIIEVEEVIGVICIGRDITEEVTVKKDLDQQESIFEVFFNQGLDGSLIVLLDNPIVWNDQINEAEVIEQIIDNHRVMRVNEAYLNQYGYKMDQIINRTAREIYNNNLEYIKSFWLQLLKDKQINREKRQRRLDGTEFWVKSEYHLFYDDYGRILGYFGSQQDITEAKKLEIELIHANKRLEYIIENENASIAIFDRNMKYLFVSKNYLHDYKKTGIDVIGESYYDIFSHLPDSFKDAHRKALMGELVISNKSKMEYDDGGFDWIRWECRPWYEDDYSVGGIILHTEIISDRIRLEDEQKKREASLSAMFEQAAVGMSYGPNKLLSNVNQKYCDIIGYTKEELANLTYIDVTHPEDAQKDKDLFAKLIVGEINTYTIEKRLIHKDNRIVWINLTVSIVPQVEGEIYVLAVIEDINKRKNVELSMQYLNHHDQLTGCLNRRSYEVTIQDLDNKTSLPLSIVMIDANGLKLVNDALGHLYGDRLLISVANVLKETVINSGQVFRIGGDEFVITLANTSYKDSLKVIDNINNQLKGLSIHDFNISVSCGSATKEKPQQSIMDIFSQAEDIMYREKLINSQSTIQKTLDHVLNVLFERNTYEKAHAINVMNYCSKMADAINYTSDDKDLLVKAAYIHDIGKIGLDLAIFEKEGRLNEDETREVKRHPEIGYRILNSSTHFADVAGTVLAHHERWDGNGYPKGLKGNQIPEHARIIAIAETYDVLISKNSYKDTIQKSDALNELLSLSGKQFDPELVIKFVEIIGKTA